MVVFSPSGWLVATRQSTDHGGSCTFRSTHWRTPTDVASFENLLKRYAKPALHVRLRDRRSAAARTRHRGQEATESRRVFWSCVDAVLEKLPIHEEHLPWLSLDRSLVIEFGPADASLVALAQKLTSQGVRPCIATTDRRLHLRCHSLQVTARDVYELMTPDA